MGRRWGKTVLGAAMVLTVLRYHGRAAWIVPEYRNGRVLWRYVSSICAPLQQSKLMDISKTERVITTHAGGFLAIYSADNIDSIRSEAFNLVVRDEAARQSEEGLQDAVIPTIADADGDLVDISTPVGKNYYYYEFMAGIQAMNEERAGWHAPSNANPNPQIQKAFLNAKRLSEEGRYSSRSFRQEWLAEFVSDGSYFVGIDACATAEPQPPLPGHTYVIGVDWARSSSGDATVFIVLDAKDNTMVAIERMVGVPFVDQEQRLTKIHHRYNNASILAEYNSIGGPIIERLQSDGLPIIGFVTTLASKHEIISSLALALENNEIKIINDSTLITELSAYERKERAGLPSYSAPAGMHDDTVIALALALEAVGKSSVEYAPSIW